MKTILNFNINTENTVVGVAKCSQKESNLFSIEITLNKVIQVQKTKGRKANVVSTPNLIIPFTLIENVEENQLENRIISFVKEYYSDGIILERID